MVAKRSQIDSYSDEYHSRVNTGISEGSEDRAVTRRFFGATAGAVLGSILLNRLTTEGAAAESGGHIDIPRELMTSVDLNGGSPDFGEVEVPRLETEVDEFGVSDSVIDKLRGHLPKIEKMKPVYEEIEKQTGVKWQYMAAIHYKEGSNNPDSSMFAGERLGSKNPDFHDVKGTDIYSNGIMAARHFIRGAKQIYGVDVTKDVTDTELSYAFLSYNRGAMYKNAKKHIGREMLPNESPYVMSGLNESYEGMHWPEVGRYTGGSDSWGEPKSVQGRESKTFGALAFVKALDQLIAV